MHIQYTYYIRMFRYNIGSFNIFAPNFLLALPEIVDEVACRNAAGIIKNGYRDEPFWVSPNSIWKTYGCQTKPTQTPFVVWNRQHGRGVEVLTSPMANCKKRPRHVRSFWNPQAWVAANLVSLSHLLQSATPDTNIMKIYSNNLANINGIVIIYYLFSRGNWLGISAKSQLVKHGNSPTRLILCTI